MRTNKPRPGAILDLSHPLANGLVVAALFNEGSGKSKNVLNPVAASMSTIRPRFKGSPKEQSGLYINYSQADEEWVDIPGLATQTLQQKTEVIGIYHNQVNNALLQRCTENADANNNGNGLMYESTTTGKWDWQGGLVDGGQLSITGVPNGYLQHILVLDKNKGSAYNSGVAYWYINGQSVSFTVDSNAAGAIAVHNKRIGGISGQDRSIIGVFHYYYVYKRALNNFEVRQLYANPYCMWKEPVLLRRFFPSTAPAAPTLSSITPATAHQGDTLDVVLAGTGFSVAFSGGSALVAFSGTGITKNSTTIDSDIQITVNITIAGGATISTRTVTVQTDNGTTGTQNFGVLAVSPPVLTSLTPNSGYGHADIAIGFFDLDLVGTDMDGANPVFTPSVGWQIGYNSPGTATLWTIYIIAPAGVTPGDYDFTFTTDDGDSNPITFTILDPASSVVGSGSSMRGGFIN